MIAPDRLYSNDEHGWTRPRWERDPWRSARAIAEEARRKVQAFKELCAKLRSEERERQEARLLLERHRRVRARPVAVLSAGRVPVPLVRSRGQAPRAPRA